MPISSLDELILRTAVITYLDNIVCINNKIVTVIIVIIVFNLFKHLSKYGKK